MLRFLVVWLLLTAAFLPTRATDCPPGSIPLVNAAKGYDWPQDYRRLEKKYSPSKVTISRLRPYFFAGANPKVCISIADLKRLSVTAQSVLSGQPDVFTKKFVAGVAGVANAQDTPVTPVTPAVLPAQTAPVATTQATEPTANGPNPALFADAADADTQQIATLQLDNERLAKKKDRLFALLMGMVFVWLLTIAGGWWFLIRKPNKVQENDQYAFLDKPTPTNTNTPANNQQAGMLHPKTDLNPMKQERDDALKQRDKAEQARRDAEEAFAAYRTQYPQKPQITQTGEATPIADSQDIKPEPEKTPEKAVFFLGTPSPAADGGMGTFLDIRQTQPDPRRSSYRFEPTNANGSEARFSFIDNPAIVSGAVRNPDTQLAPACDYGSVNANAQRIITETPGKARKQADVWIVIQKAKIRFA